eukprot:PhM_4_TR10935/c0_g1_i1/m.40184/K03349/APC2; anaphase-promoting complex subunit 2
MIMDALLLDSVSAFDAKTTSSLKQEALDASVDDIALMMLSLDDGVVRSLENISDVETWMPTARQRVAYCRDVHWAVRSRVPNRDVITLGRVHHDFLTKFGVEETSLEHVISLVADSPSLTGDFVSLQLHRLSAVRRAATRCFDRLVDGIVDAVDDFEAHLESLLEQAAAVAKTPLWSCVMGATVEEGTVSAVCRRLLASSGSAFFDIVADYPDSQPAVEDMHSALAKLLPDEAAAARQSISRDVLAQYRRRLLHAGARTHDILTMHVTTAWVVGHLGLSRDVLTATVRYLRTRKDGLDAVVRCLMDPTELGVPVPTSAVADYDSDDEDESGSIDIVGTLLTSFGVDSVVRQFRETLRDNLLSATLNLEKEYKTVETLKLSLGEEAMRQCSIMMNDVSTSRRITSLAKTSKPMSVTVVSRTCWPNLKALDVKVHPTLQSVLDEYLNVFKKQKPNRSLTWCFHYGTVDLELALPASEPRAVSLTFVQASAALHVADRGGALPLRELSNLLGVPVAALEAQLDDSQGVLCVSNGVVELQTSTKTTRRVAAAVEASPLDDLSQEEVTVMENSVLAMLKAGGGTRAAAQIENTLRMFGQLKGTAESFRAVLARLVAADKIVAKENNTIYSLKK